MSVAQGDKEKAPDREWTPLSGTTQAPEKTAHGRILISIVNSGSGRYFQSHFLGNVSVTGQPGKRGGALGCTV